MAIMADFHGNFPAVSAIEDDLRCVLQEYGRNAFNRLWILGDLVDPMPWPVEVIHSVRAWAGDLVPGEPTLLAGNHEGYLYKLIGMEYTVDEVRRCIELTRALLEGTEESRWLQDRCTSPSGDPLDPMNRNLRSQAILGPQDLGREGAFITLCHGMARPPVCWWRHSPEKDGALPARLDMDYLRSRVVGDGMECGVEFCGHSHEAFGWFRPLGVEEVHELPLSSAEFTCLSPGDYVICVGSAGLDRRGVQDACYQLQYLLLDIGERHDFAIQVRSVVLEESRLRVDVLKRLIGRCEPDLISDLMRFCGLY